MDIKEMVKMRIDGATFQEIADACGVTKQAVQQKVSAYYNGQLKSKRGRKLNIQKIKYKGIYEYFVENPTETLTSFVNKVFGENGRCNSNVNKMSDFLYRKRESRFSIAQIKRICEIVGQPFEKTFKEYDYND